MLSRLRVYLDSHGIGAESFQCRHAVDCRSAGGQFTTAKESFVGPRYESGELPRILFLSLDSGSSEADPRRKTLAAVREVELACDVLSLPKGRHWYQTHELAWLLLQQFKPSLQLAEISSYFAHVNSAKCCMNNPLRAQASDVLFDNCREFIPGELRILQPDIIVSQGGRAQKVVEQFREIKTVAETIRIVRCGDKDALWIATYHPTARGGLYGKQKAANQIRWRQAVSTFIRDAAS